MAATIVLFIVYCFIDGYVARTVAGYWKEEGNLREADLVVEVRTRRGES